MNYPLTDAAAYQRGVSYLEQVQSLVLEPGMVDVMQNLRDRVAICTWIGQQIEAVNTELQHCLEACHDCFHPTERPVIEIFAVPLAPAFGIDGLCNVLRRPIAILVDVGRILPQDWLSIVAHEYAHAYSGDFGHHQQFVNVLYHLCLGLGLEPPTGANADQLRYWPFCQSTQDPLAFWRGEG